MKNKNNLFFNIFFLLIVVPIMLLSVYNYSGTKIIYLLYSLSAIIFFIYLTNSKSFFFENFLALYFFLGYWVSFSIKISFFNSDFKNYSDGFGDFDFSKHSYDNVLSVCMLSFVSLIIGSFIRRKVISYQIVNLSLFKHEKKEKLFLNDKSLFFSFIIGIFFLSFLNYYYIFFQRGTVTNPDVHILIANFSKWFFTMAYITLFAFFITYILRKKNNFPLYLVITYLITELVISISILSRGSIFNGTSILWGIKKFMPLKHIKKILFLFSFLGILFIINIIVVKELRTNQAMKGNDRFTINPIDGTTDDKLYPNYEKNYDLNIISKINRILVSRLHGFEAIMAVEGHQYKGLDFFYRALKIKNSTDELSFFDTMKNDPRHTDFSNVSITIPGMIAFLYYSNSYILIFFSLIFILILICLIEKLIFHYTSGNLIFLSFIGHSFAYRLWHFGHNPSNTHMFLLSIFLSCLLIIFLNRIFK